MKLFQLNNFVIKFLGICNLHLNQHTNVRNKLIFRRRTTHYRNPPHRQAAHQMNQILFVTTFFFLSKLWQKSKSQFILNLVLNKTRMQRICEWCNCEWDISVENFDENQKEIKSNRLSFFYILWKNPDAQNRNYFPLCYSTMCQQTNVSAALKSSHVVINLSFARKNKSKENILTPKKKTEKFIVFVIVCCSGCRTNRGFL